MTKKDNESTYRVIQFELKKGNPLTEYLLGLMKNSNNLYNATNFYIRQVFTAFSEENKPLHDLQKEVILELQKAIPQINADLKTKYDRLCSKDLVEYQKALKVNPKAKFKERKAPKQHEMPTVGKNFLPYETLDAYFNFTKNVDYYSLPGQVNQQIMKKVIANWKSFFESLKDFKANPSKYTGRPKAPRYKTKGGLNELVFTNQICKVKTAKDGKQFLRFPKTDLTFNLSKHLVNQLNKQYVFKQVRVQKWYDSVKLEIVLDCSKTVVPLIPKESITRVMAIDLGVNNLATCVSNTGMQPTIINGKPLKSMNQYYNKLRAKLYSSLRIGKQPNEGLFSTSRLEKLDKKRYLQIKDYLHKASKQIVDLALANQIDQVIVGYNQRWKETVVMHKSDKQTFIQLPFTMFLNQLEYKLHAVGIHFLKVEESYTSQSSFLDNDTIPTYGDKEIPKFSGKRITRGLYKSSQGILINADVNGAANILRKHCNLPINLTHKLLSQVKKINIKHATICRNQKTRNSQRLSGIACSPTNCVVV